MDIPKKLQHTSQDITVHLQQQWSRLTGLEQATILRSQVRFHQVIKEETFRLLQGILEAYTSGR
ncbi:MAG: hypothetical protein WC046_08820 [Candidatus Bathyarchaeia archaeon]